MKVIKSTGLLVSALLTSSNILFAQQPAEISVFIKTPEGKYVGQVAGGGLDAISTAVTAKQTFGLIDLNGGKVADGDKIKIRTDASQWREDKDKALIHRVPAKGANEEECIFKLRIKDKLIFLETPSGKFVKVNGEVVGTTGDVKSATPFDIETAAPPVQPASYTSAFKFLNGNYIGMVAGGGLDAAANEIRTNQVFQVIDLNGGALVNGDQIKVIFSQSQMHEDKDKNVIHRVPTRGAKEEECIFKLLVFGSNIRLQAPSGRYIAVAPDGRSLTTTDKKDELSLLTAVPNPTPKVK